MSPDLAVRPAAADADAAVAILRDPGLPGEPWSDGEIVDALAALLDATASDPPLAVAATTARWLDAIAAGAELPGKD